MESVKNDKTDGPDIPDKSSPASGHQQVTCPYCDSAAELVHGKEIYPRAGPPQNGMYWLCRPCQAWAGTHKNSVRHAPKASLANAALRKARQEAHAAFDPIWRDNLMGRTIAYAWLAQELGIKTKHCHIGFFDAQRCVEVVRLSRQLIEDLTADLISQSIDPPVFLGKRSHTCHAF